MAVETKYVIVQNGKFLSPSGERTLARLNEYVSFSTFEGAEQFLEVSGSVGEYRITPITVKS